ncbi:hypothetical protein IJG78_01370 [Candidatus Saccharibacteria bacterium]|nr:hypothetical protein [Candidatus Saccharibacteria bacterium]
MTTTDNVITNTGTITPTGDETNVTYGVSASSSQVAGLYKTTLVYTATTIDGDPTPSVPEFFTATYMQDMTPSICSSATTPSVDATVSDTTGEYDGDTNYVPETTLIDYRGTDGTGTASSPATGSNVRSYTVRKLADGNCWMSENLKLTLSTSHSYEVGTFDGGTASWTPNEDTSSTNPYNVAISQNTIANDSTTGEWYYPWYAATAGQGTNTENPTIAQSICPKGWKLPNGGANAAPSFYSIMHTYSATTTDKIKAAPLSYTAVGAYSSGSLDVDGTSFGLYWSASSLNSNGSLAMIFNTSNVVLLGRDKGTGFSVRCVAIPSN